MPAFQDNCSIDGMVHTFVSVGISLGLPMHQLSLDPYPLLLPVQKEVDALPLRPTCPRLLATAVIARGTTPTPALLKQVFMYCHLGTLLPRKRPSGIETGLSHSTMNNPINVPTVPPDRLLQALEGPVAPSYGADHSPDKAELFVPDVSYSGNALHCVIVEDVHVVQTRSQAKAKGKAQAVFSKPYSHQLLDKAPDECPGPSTDTFHLKGVNARDPVSGGWPAVSGGNLGQGFCGQGPLQERS
ncbi:hypothetical protein DSO57_1012397 [Entomophthora muscae]|uniref:Uncharacterized protein n=1 Tax=Entomophthora muscae TaxID=34485 RepID=A0ACC2UEV6_9FUNG|nr:hypothetical protein DSO57_1012397 [Entomophthora muscae]